MVEYLVTSAKAFTNGIPISEYFNVMRIKQDRKTVYNVSGGCSSGNGKNEEDAG